MGSQVRVHDDISRSWWQEQLRIDKIIPKQEVVVGNRQRQTDRHSGMAPAFCKLKHTFSNKTILLVLLK